MAAPTPLGVHQVNSNEPYALVEDLNWVGITADAAIAFVKARAEYLTDKAVTDAGELSRRALDEARALSQRALDALPGLVVAEVGRIDAQAELARLGLDEHLSSQRSNGVRAMVQRIRQLSDAAA